MNEKGSITALFKGRPKFYLVLIAVSPILLSFLFHTMALYSAHRFRWSWFEEGDASVQDPPPVVIQGEGQANNRLKFQGLDKLDDFDADDDLINPVPEIEYRPVVPKIDVLPTPKDADTLDIISVDAASMNSKSEWENPATGGMPLDTGTKMFVGSFSRHIQVLREGGLDVVFVFDTTSSMSNYINEVKLKIINLAATFRNVVPTCRIGLVSYCDHSDPHVTRQSPLTYGVKSLKAFMASIELCNGGDEREAVAEGLKVAVQKMGWNEKSKKFILIIGDAPPHTEEMQDAVDLVGSFKNSGGKLSALDIRKPKPYSKAYWRQHIQPTIKDPAIESYEYLTDSEQVMDAFRTLAEEGGGESARLVNEKKVIKHMLLLIFGTRWEIYLDEFMENI